MTSRDQVAGLAATAVVATALVLGFVTLGGPGTQRLVQTDNRRIQDISLIASAVGRKWATSNHALPASLSEISGVGSASRDPLTGALYEYRPGGTSDYQLCASFARDYRQEGRQEGRISSWAHPAGHYCFQLDASRPLEPFYRY